MNDHRISPARRDEIITQVVPSKDRDYGLTMPSAVALIAAAFAGIHGIPEDRMTALLEEIAVIEYNAASYNRFAQFRGPRFRKEVMRERYRGAGNLPWCDPLRMLDLCPTTDGAGAVLLSCERQLCGRKALVKLTGHALVNDFNRIVHRARMEMLAATELAAERAYAMAGIPMDRTLDGGFLVTEWPKGFFAEIHDAFGPLYLLNLINLGMFSLGEAEKAILDGRTDPDSASCTLPINPSGGLKDGHPVGGTGIIKMVETYWQILGSPNGIDLRKAPIDFEPSLAVVHSVGGPGSINGVVVMEHADNSPRPKTRLAGPERKLDGRRTFRDGNFPKPGKFIASTRRHLYDANDRSRGEVGRIDIGVVQLLEDGEPGPRRLALPMDERPLRYGDDVRLWRSYRDGRYHYEGVY